MEGPPAPPETKEKEPITDAQCLEALKAENLELVREWYAEQENIADQDPSPQSRLNLTLKLALLQLQAEVIDPDTGENYGLGTLEAAREDAHQRYDDDAIKKIDDIMSAARERR